ncbi:hypothetical protein [Streptomyces plumbiresistens]|uniref:hypothetical protein n=1 Tax=Streptomyces plumbiresistens TaxID=511811 RepID=UPI0031F1A1F1
MLRSGERRLSAGQRLARWNAREQALIADSEDTEFIDSTLKESRPPWSAPPRCALGVSQPLPEYG